MPGRLLVGDRTPTDQVAMVRTIVLESCRCRRRTARGRARSSRMRSRQVEGASDLIGWCSTRVGGRRSSSCTRSRPLVDADRIKAARIGDPLGVDLTERAADL
ncbi:hypothetical protein EVAR_3854_1 [Eumeta japonica]|uniref:Uncharacterized protein n=1 Tax=Eumeta variegata TaxID=151549 RepID=A0A4C1ST08_EUMVA|nr:hypothetical protein EVAR_3854_1 [Eumeta japonica]